jgi:hypothetical protein
VGSFRQRHCIALSIMELRLGRTTIRMYLLLVRLILSPDASLNMFSMLWMILIFCICAGVKMVVSSANCRNVVLRFGIKTKRD